MIEPVVPRRRSPFRLLTPFRRHPYYKSYEPSRPLAALTAACCRLPFSRPESPRRATACSRSARPFAVTTSGIGYIVTPERLDFLVYLDGRDSEPFVWVSDSPAINSFGTPVGSVVASCNGTAFRPWVEPGKHVCSLEHGADEARAHVLLVARLPAARGRIDDLAEDDQRAVRIPARAGACDPACATPPATAPPRPPPPPARRRLPPRRRSRRRRRARRRGTRRRRCRRGTATRASARSSTSGSRTSSTRR